MKRFLLRAVRSLLILGGLFALQPAWAQTITTVTGTVLDPSGVPYAQAAVNITLTQPAGSASAVVTATNSPVIIPFGATTNASGVFTVNLVANASITPAATTWNFRVCTPVVPPPLGTGSSCVSITGVTIAGASQDVTATFNAVPPPALINAVGSQRVATSSATLQGANIAATTLFTVPANSPGTYRLDCYVVLTRAATTSSTLPACNAIYTDNDSGAAETVAQTTSPTANTVGTVGADATTALPIFHAAAGTNIQFSTTGFASVGATSMQYAIRVKLEFLGP